MSYNCPHDLRNMPQNCPHIATLVRLLSGAVPGPDVRDRDPAHSDLLRDRAHHPVRPAVSAHARLVLAAARDSRQNTPRYDSTVFIMTMMTTTMIIIIIFFIPRVV